jgi:sugar lactone lactonase YvrE
MRPISRAAIAAAAVILSYRGLGAADLAKLRYLVSAYADEKGNGFKLPEAVACDAGGQMIVGDTGNDRLVRFAFRDKALTGGTEIKIPELAEPSRVVVTSNGTIFALDARRRRIVRLGPDGAFQAAVTLDGAPPPTATLPKSIALDASDNLYVLDIKGARVLVLNAAGQFQRAVPLPDGAGFVTDLAVDAGANILLLDSEKRRLYAAAADATAFQPLGGDLSDTVTTMPTALTINRGFIFIVEGAGSSIVTLARDGTFLARQLTLGWTEGALNHPGQMCVNSRGEVFVADRDNARVQVFSLIH